MADTPQTVGEQLIMVDFDGTIVPWSGLMEKKETFPEVAEAMQEMKDAGYTIGIFSSRMSPTWAYRAGTTLTIQKYFIEETLRYFGIPFDFVTGEKRPALAYFDDMAVHVPDGELASILRVWRTRRARENG